MNNIEKVSSLAAGTDKATTVKSKVEDAKAKAKAAAKRPATNMAETDAKELAKGRAIRKK